MPAVELFVLAVGLSMDAFAVAVCAGLTMKKAAFNKMLIVGLYFGFFQGIMPLIGYGLAINFAEKIQAFDHWIAFGLLTFLGGKMFWGGLKREEEPTQGESLSPRRMLPLALATSIDALAVGISFAFLQINIVPAVSLIGLTTLVFSMAGVKIGHLFGMRFKSKAELAGGAILIIIGLRIWVTHVLAV